MMRRLTADEADLLTAVRGLLTDLAKAADDGVLTTVAAREGQAQSPWDGYRLGLIRERCDQAAEGVFNAVNALSSYWDDPQAKRVLHAERVPV